MFKHAISWAVTVFLCIQVCQGDDGPRFRGPNGTGIPTDKGLHSEHETALDRYIGKPDPSYGWKLTRTIEGDGYTGFVLDLTSQSWRSEEEVDRPVWKHWLTIIKPDTATMNKALLYIGGGRNGDAAPEAVSERSLRMALETGTVIAAGGVAVPP